MKKLIKKLMNWIRKMEYSGEDYKIPLNELIRRSITRFNEKTGNLFPFCPQCYVQACRYGKKDHNTIMNFRRSKISLAVPVRDDMFFKCPSCFHTVHFGIPLSREEAEKEIELRGNNPWILSPTYRFDERDKKEILERLERLGYIE